MQKHGGIKQQRMVGQCRELGGRGKPRVGGRPCGEDSGTMTRAGLQRVL